MTIVGSLLAALAAVALGCALKRPSPVARRLALFPRGLAAPRLFRWRPVASRDLAHSGLAWSAETLLAAKAVGAASAAVLAGAATQALALGPLVPILAAYCGFIGPSILVERRASARRAAAEGAVASLVERTEALVAAGRPAATALASLSLRPTGVTLLDMALSLAASDYALGAPLFRSLAVRSDDAGLPTLAALARELDRSRDLARGSLATIVLVRDGLRAAERHRALEAASRVEGRLMLVLVLCYLPALMLLVVVPLLLGLLDGLFV